MLLEVVPDVFVEAAMGLISLASRVSAGAAEAQAEDSVINKVVGSKDSAGKEGQISLNKRFGERDSEKTDWSESYLLDLLFAMIPLPGQTNEFFAGVPRKVLARLRKNRLIPGCGGGFLLPTMAVQAPAVKSPTDGYTAKVLRRMGLQFVRSDIHIPAELERELGVRPLSAILCDVLAFASKLWADKRSSTASVTGSGFPESSENDKNAMQGSEEKGLDAVEFDGAWLVYVLAGLERSSECSNRIDELKALPLFPLAGGSELARPRDGHIFEVDGATAASDLPLWLTAGIRVLCPNFHAELTGDRAASSMARRLGLRSVDSEVFLLKHLVPAMAVPALSNEALVRLLAAAKRMATAVAPGLLGGRFEAEMVRVGALLIDTHGRRVPAGTDPLHFPQQYVPAGIPAFQASEILPPLPDRGDQADSDPWPLLSSAYLECDSDRSGWYSLLRGLGVTIFVHVNPQPPYNSQELSFLLSTAYSEASGGVECTASELKRLTTIGSILSRLWGIEYRELANTADATTAESSESFVSLLRRLPWVPGTDGKLHKPSDLYASNAATALQVLGERALRCVAGGVDGMLSIDLWVRADLSASDAVTLLEAWAAKGESVSLDLMLRVYSFLDNSVRDPAAAGLLATLKAMNCIFVPNRHAVSAFDPKHTDKLPNGLAFVLRRNDAVPGKWIPPKDCVWTDQSHLLDNFSCWKNGLRISDGEHLLAAQAAGRRGLRFYYREDLKDFFCRSSGLGIAYEPPHECYLEMWRSAADVRPATRYSIACVLRICVHFSYEFAHEHRELSDESAVESSPLLRIVVSRAASLFVPNASGDSLSALSRVRWIADVDQDRAIKEHWFGSQILEHCVPFKHNGLHGVCDASVPGAMHARHPKRGADNGQEDTDEPANVANLDKQMGIFYRDMLQLPRLRDVLTRQVKCQARSAEGRVDAKAETAIRSDEAVHVNDAELRAPERCPFCHVAIRTIQSWLHEQIQGGEEAEPEKQSFGISASHIVESVRRLRLRRVAAVETYERWVAASSTGLAGIPGAALRFESQPVSRRQVACGIDLSDTGGPVILVSESSLQACPPELVAAAFGRICSGEEVNLSGQFSIGWVWPECVCMQSLRCSALYSSQIFRHVLDYFLLISGEL
jgi:hypothetical protein